MGARHTARPAFLDDWIDLDVLRQVNPLLQGRRFAVAADGNFAIVLCLSPAELERIVAERGVPLAW